MTASGEDTERLRQLEESLWRAESRFDREAMRGPVGWRLRFHQGTPIPQAGPGASEPLEER